MARLDFRAYCSSICLWNHSWRGARLGGAKIAMITTDGTDEIVGGAVVGSNDRMRWSAGAREAPRGIGFRVAASLLVGKALFCGDFI